MKKPRWAQLADEAFEKADEAFAAGIAAANAAGDPAEGGEVEIPIGKITRIRARTFRDRLKFALIMIFKGRVFVRIRPKP